ncbi:MULTISPECIES: hypothetical protein [Pasteurellaceae]|uniref:hypothetical protein n=1 Tax=Pasteurellaceae TaxID=712 RepID=UPI00050991FF|nr:hypothetical protein AUSP0078_00008 [uncultured phage]
MELAFRLIQWITAFILVVLAIVILEDRWIVVVSGLFGGFSFFIGWLIYDEYKCRKENKRLATEWKKRKNSWVEYEINRPITQKTLQKKQRPIITGTVSRVNARTGKETVLANVKVDLKDE